MIKVWLYCGFPLIFLISSCVHVQEIEIQPEVGGIISVRPPRDPKAREQATSIMKSNCGKKTPKIFKEGFVKIGEDTSAQVQKSNDKNNSINLFSGKKSSKDVENNQVSSSTRDVSEWRIQYKCQ